MTQNAVEVQDLNEETEELRAQRLYEEQEARDSIAYQLLQTQRRAWEQVRAQQVVTFAERLPRTPEYEMNDWLMKHPEWRVSQMTSASSSEVGDYGATWTYQYITCLMERWK